MSPAASDQHGPSDDPDGPSDDPDGADAGHPATVPHGPFPGCPAPPGAEAPVGEPARGDPPRRWVRLGGAALGAVLGIGLLGLPLGLLWSALAPDVSVRKTEDGAALTQPQPEQFIAADGWFSLLGFGFGVLVAIAAWVVLRRWRGPLGLIVVVLGAVGAAVVAWRVGREMGLAEYRRLLAGAPVGQTLDKPPDLRAGGFEWVAGVIPTVQGNLLLPAFGAAVVYTLLAGWSRYATLRAETEPPVGPGRPQGAPSAPDTERGGSLSSDHPAPRDPPAAPAPPGPGAAGPSRG